MTDNLQQNGVFFVTTSTYCG